MLAVVLDEVFASLPENERPKPDSYFYKKHSDHAGFKPTPEMQAVLDSQKARNAAAAAAAANAAAASDLVVPEIKAPATEK
jgi:hypothetical protein